MDAPVLGQLQLHVAEEELVVLEAVLDDDGPRRAKLRVNEECHLVRHGARLPAAVVGLLAAPQWRLRAQPSLPRVCSWTPTQDTSVRQSSEALALNTRY